MLSNIKDLKTRVFIIAILGLGMVYCSAKVTCNVEGKWTIEIGEPNPIIAGGFFTISAGLLGISLTNASNNEQSNQSISEISGTEKNKG